MESKQAILTLRSNGLSYADIKRQCPYYSQQHIKEICLEHGLVKVLSNVKSKDKRYIVRYYPNMNCIRPENPIIEKVIKPVVPQKVQYLKPIFEKVKNYKDLLKESIKRHPEEKYTKALAKRRIIR